MSAQYMAAPNQPWASSHYGQPSPPPYENASPVYPTANLPHNNSDANLYGQPEPKEYRRGTASKLHPRNWSRRTWIIVPIVAVVILVAIIIGAVLGVRANRYPDYSYLRYTQSAAYSGESFFDNFAYFNAPDPAEGVPIIYDSKVDAATRNITGLSSSGRPYIQLNTTSPAIYDNGTASSQVFAHSARLTSNSQFDDGLFLFDVYHAPYGCAVWPAVWLTGPQATWPAGGEIDIIEAVNKGDTGVQTTLHTSNGCSMSTKRQMSGKATQSDCHNTTNANAGCGVEGPITSYGAALNAAGGGVWALEWRAAGIRSWFFPRASIPTDVQAGLDGDAGSPDPTTWGTPLADFPNTDCDVTTHFSNMTLIANIDTCGQYAGQASVWEASGCQTGTQTCAEYVQANPDQFNEAYWEFGAWKIFTASSASKSKRWLW